MSQRRNFGLAAEAAGGKPQNFSRKHSLGNRECCPGSRKHHQIHPFRKRLTACKSFAGLEHLESFSKLRKHLTRECLELLDFHTHVTVTEVMVLQHVPQQKPQRMNGHCAHVPVDLPECTDSRHCAHVPADLPKCTDGKHCPPVAVDVPKCTDGKHCAPVLVDLPRCTDGKHCSPGLVDLPNCADGKHCSWEEQMVLSDKAATAAADGCPDVLALSGCSCCLCLPFP